MKQATAILFLLMFSGVLLACQSKPTAIEAREVWARVANQGGNGAVYLILRNHSDREDELIGASSDVAQWVELHKTEVNEQGVMTMQKQDTIALPVKGDLRLEPGGYHVMLLGLKRDLKEGDTFQIVLKFKTHPDLPLQVTVRGGGMQMQPGGGHDQGNSSHDHPKHSPTP